MKKFKHVLLVSAFLIVFVNVGWGQATLPFSYDLGKPSGVTGLTHTGLGTDYSASPKMKFDDTGDNLILNFSGNPGTLSFAIKWNQSTSASRFPGDFELLESSNGSTYSRVQLYNSSNGTALPNATVVTETFTTLQSSTRYIKWNYTAKSNGNIAIGAIILSAGTGTLPPTPVSTAATNINSTSFTANWNTVTEATSYRLDVATSNTFDPGTPGGTLINEGFNGGLTPPSGWTFTNIGGTYTTSSNYGISSPSLQMDATGDRIETSAFSNPTQLSFWIKGQGTDGASALLVEEYYSSSWNTIANITSLPTTGTTKTYSLNSLTTKVRFTFTKSSGNLAFDDVIITGTTVNTFVTGYQDKTISAPSISDAVTGLSSNTTYYYRVRAVNANGTSANSNVISVTTTIPSLIYTWNVTGTGDWTTASNWSPARSAPGLGDKLIFNNGQTLTITNIPAQTISQIEVSGNTIVNLQAGTAGNILTLQGGTGVDLSVSSGSQLNFTGTNSLLMPLQTGVTGSISGNISFTNADHRLSASDVSAITFNSGSIFTAGTGVIGNVFGSTGTNSSVVFSNGATYVQIGGANPFGISTTDNIVTFQTGSLYKLQSSVLPSLTNRVYANFEYDFNGIVTNTISGSSAWTFDNLIISQGTFNANVSIPVNCKGNITVANGSTFGFNPASASDFSFNGSSSQTISGTGTLTFGDKVTLKINNASGVVLQKDLTLNGGLTFVSGILNTGSNFLDFGASATYPTESNSNYILGNARIIGKPVGTASLSFLGAYIHAGTDDIGNVNVTRTTGSSYTLGTNSGINCSWNIVPATQPANGRILELNWYSVLDNGKNFSSSNKAQVWKSTNNGANWTDMGLLVDVSISNPRTIANINTTTFSVWSVSAQDAPLPISLSYLNSSVNNRNIKLNWTTASEINNCGFDVERAEIRSQNLEFSKIEFISGHGTINNPTNYSFEDKNLQSGKYKYRLKQIDVNGNFEYFVLNGEVEIGVPKTFNLSQNYPNPFNPVTKINFDLPENSKVDLRLYDMLGREIATLVNEVRTAGYYTVNFDASNLSSGMYFYRMNTGKFSSIKKMVVLK